MKDYYARLIKTSLKAILDRYFGNPEYKFIDTKFSLITGEDFDLDPTPALAFRRRDYVYGWIQGRGLEALAGHLDFVPEERTRILRLLSEVIDSMETLRRRAGRVWFIMRPDGTPLGVKNFSQLMPATLPVHGATYSDLFYYKGLFAAASALGNANLKDLAAKEFFQTVTAIANCDFLTDQQPFDPANPVAHNPDRHLQGPRMIALGGLANLMAHDESFDWARIAADFITHVLERHVCHANGLVEWGFMEAVTPAGTPFKINGKVLGDPGHAGEFVGLALKCLRQRKFGESFPELAKRMREELPQILEVNFRLGFSAEAGGICKSVDLATGEKMNSDMPWWNLPETMRAAAFAGNGEILEECDRAFRENFVNEKVHMMAYQNRNALGQVVETIPATPDADPGYHTNLSMIDVLAHPIFRPKNHFSH